MDLGWQLVLDCLGCEEPPFSKGTLVAHRQRMIEHGLDRRLIERTVEVWQSRSVALALVRCVLRWIATPSLAPRDCQRPTHCCRGCAHAPRSQEPKPTYRR